MALNPLMDENSSKIEKMHELIESFLSKVDDASNVNDLGLSIFAVCAAMGLTIDKARREFIQANFVNIHQINQPFKEFKKNIINSLRTYLETQIR